MKSGVKKIFLHGWATDGRVWKGQLGRFKDSIAPDLPGHGGGKKWSEPTLEPAVEFLDSILNGCGEGIVGIGWSLGAQVLISAGERTRLKGLILVGATPSFVRREGLPWGKEKSMVKKMLMDMGKDTEDTLKRFYRLNFTEKELSGRGANGFLGLYTGVAQRFDITGVKTALSSLIDMDLREKLSSIDVPTLIIHGSDDSVVSVEAALYLKEKIKGARLEIFNRAGHAPFVTEEKKFNGIVEEFIENL